VLKQLSDINSLSELNSWFNNIAWGIPLIILLVGGGLVLMIFSRLIPFTGFAHALRLTLGRYHHPGDDHDPGQISHFKALCNALAATVGLGNIAGVAVAINQGGPGAVFWMWITAIVGMNTKFFECTLAVMYRGKDHTGQIQGGPMYVIDNALPRAFKPLAIFFAVCGLVGTTAIFTANQTTAFIYDVWAKPLASDASWLGMPRDKVLIGIALAALITYVLLGGLKRLAQWTSALVPAMCLFYILGSITALALKPDAIPQAFASIFTSAFSIQAGVGGVEGGLVAILIIGVKRAAFSNEAGIGTAPMAHSNAKTTEPISEGLVAMLGPMIDTLIVCTMTALVILVFVPPNELSQYNKILLTNHAFTNAFGQWGTHTLGIAVALFGFSTMVGMANYNSKCFNYLLRNRLGTPGPKIFLTWFAATLILGAALPSDDMLNLVDSAYALMAIPTMTSTIILAPHVTRALRTYKQKHFGNTSTQ
jgi:alanine or glycine:cation symporter, AGCS family